MLRWIKVMGWNAGLATTTIQPELSRIKLYVCQSGNPKSSIFLYLPFVDFSAMFDWMVRIAEQESKWSSATAGPPVISRPGRIFWSSWSL